MPPTSTGILDASPWPSTTGPPRCATPFARARRSCWPAWRRWTSCWPCCCSPSARSALTDGERRLAGQMIRQSDNESAHRLYTAIGGNQGLSDTLRRLGIAHTRPGPGSSWGLTRSSPSDQVKVLEKLTDPAGPVSARNRRYALSLMSSVDRTQAWGVSAAASGGRVALKNGWLPARAHGGLWTINTVGRLALPGHELLIAVLSERSQDMSAGVSLVERVARTAVRAFTGVRTPLTSPRPQSERSPGPPTVGVRLAERDLCPAAGCQAWPVDTNQPAPPGSRADR
ncbi:serine hydrolase [Nonomuraea recticatena]|uniref:serine hydrolase n=1 Tax=Nonomuraea recticatena TaxID=46178 RepID=UPI00361182AE